MQNNDIKWKQSNEKHPLQFVKRIFTKFLSKKYLLRMFHNIFPVLLQLCDSTDIFHWYLILLQVKSVFLIAILITTHVQSVSIINNIWYQQLYQDVSLSYVIGYYYFFYYVTNW